MEWFVGLFVLICVLALISEVHEKWHKRQMLEIQKKGSNVYA